MAATKAQKESVTIKQEDEPMVEDAAPVKAEPEVNPLEKTPPSLEVVTAPKDLPDVRNVPISAQNRQKTDPKLEAQIYREMDNLAQILKIAQIRVNEILRKQTVSAIPASNLEALQRYLQRSRTLYTPSVNFSIPTVNILVEIDGPKKYKFAFNEGNLCKDPIAAVVITLKYHDGDKLAVQGVNAVSPHKEPGKTPNTFVTVGYWVLESIEEV